MKIAFHSNQLCRQGTEVALYDYARHSEEQLGHQPLIVYDRTNPNNDPGAIAKFERRFEVVGYDRFSEVEPALARAGADLLYLIKSGKNDGKLSRQIPNAVHAVFAKSERHRHGERYAYVSKWLADTCSGGRLPFVPHMIDLPLPAGDLRGELGIDADMLVLGGYGGRDSFDVPFAAEAVRRAVERRSDLFFLFMNFTPFADHPRIRFLPGSTDMALKAAFIDTCDAMLHARLLGESFGISCGEFSIRNKRVLTYGGSRHRSHLAILGEAALVYRTGAELERSLAGLDRAALRAGQWDRYSADYAPVPVMRKFASVFIDGEGMPPPRRSLWSRLGLGG